MDKRNLSPSSLPDIVSVIVVVRNAADVILNCLNSIKAQVFPAYRMELIVVDGCSEDRSVAIVEDFFNKYSSCFSRCALLSNPNKILASGWNIGLRNSNGSFVVRIDAHSFISENYIGRAYEFLSAHPAVSGVGGVLKTLPRSSEPSSSAIAKLVSSPFGVGNSPFRRKAFDGAFQSDTAVFALYRISMFDSTGFFDEQLDRGQDIALHAIATAKGHQLWTCGNMQIFHYAPASISTFLKKSFQTGYWAVFGGRPRVRHIIPSLFVMYLFLFLVLAILNLFVLDKSIYLSFFSMPLMIYAAMLFYVAIVRVRLGRYFYLPFLFHVNYGLGGIRAIIDKIKAKMIFCISKKIK